MATFATTKYKSSKTNTNVYFRIQCIPFLVTTLVLIIQLCFYRVILAVDLIKTALKVTNHYISKITGTLNISYDYTGKTLDR